MRRAFLALLAVLTIGFPMAACTPVAHAAGCAWTPNTTNNLWPDLAASYWTTPLPAGAKATITGVRPDARYFALTSYNWYGGILSHVNDTTLGDGYRVTVAPSGANMTSPWLVAGYLLFRAYVPNGKVALPTVTMNGVTLAPCTDGTPPTFTPGAPSSSATSTGWSLTTYESGAALFPNPDNGYLSATIAAPAPGGVVTISGKAPELVRYWSLCSNNESGAVVDCVHDTQVPLDANGFYRITLGTAAQKAVGQAMMVYSDRVFFRNLLRQQLTGDYAPTVSY